jgi:5-methylcytosine-specific restriction protein A
MPLLYFWRGDNYRRDLDMGAGYNLNQANSLLHDIDIGDSLWAFTRNRAGDYVLAAELVVSAKTRNAKTFRYGGYRIWGDLTKSRYFQVENQPSVEHLLRGLSCAPRADVLGHSFQGGRAVRQLTLADDDVLRAAAKSLLLEPRAQLIPEQQLEAEIAKGNQEDVRRLLERLPHGIARERLAYLYTKPPTRSRRFAITLHGLYGGKCQICLWSPFDDYGQQLCHGHHIHWLCRGGQDTIHNMVLVCPNHHAAIHRCDAPFDYADMAFVFPKNRGRLQLNLHLEHAPRFRTTRDRA